MPDTSQLVSEFRPHADALLAIARELDRRFVFTSTFRTRKDQQRLYSRFVKGLSPLPALPPGRSQHEKGLAVDLARPGTDPRDDELLAALGAAWRKAGGVWGGEADPVHFEAPKRWTGRT